MPSVLGFRLPAEPSWTATEKSRVKSPSQGVSPQPRFQPLPQPARGSHWPASWKQYAIVRTPRGARSTNRDDTDSSRETWDRSARRPALEIPQKKATSCCCWRETNQLSGGGAPRRFKTTESILPRSRPCSGGGNGPAGASRHATNVPPRPMTSEAPTVQLPAALHFAPGKQVLS